MADKPKPRHRSGPTPDVLRKGGPMRDRKKYTRKPKHKKPEDRD